ncbi:MAG: RusA family crossover junction endodeoxyribonuclease [Synechococcaceae cyanobacterium]|nr:RusA family crossover junction endodeoxyribonuclease [Synechococcaceae cyanobacterium]
MERQAGGKLRIADFELPLPLQPKARPRFAGHAYKDAAYRDWSRQCRAILAEWWAIPPLDKGQVIAVQFTFRGPGRSDLDNLQGAVMDAGKGIVWVDDRVTILRRIVAEWEPAPTNKQSIYLKVVWNDLPKL